MQAVRQTVYTTTTEEAAAAAVVVYADYKHDSNRPALFI